MNSIRKKTMAAAFAITLVSSVSVAQQSSMETHTGMDHGAMNHASTVKDTDAHGSHKTMEQQSGQVMGVGIIHRISKLNKMVNLTHEPIPALNWPEMTMDLPVADSVDLGALKKGEKVKFHLELGADKKYVITNIMKP